jgi:hypothetical protein
MTKKKKAKKGKKLDPVKRPTPARKPRQARLPGTEDAAIEELEALAENYAGARDRQREAGKEQKELRKSIATAMHNNGKTTYRHGGVFITLLDNDEEVRVKVSKPGEAEQTTIAVDEEPEPAEG